MRLISAVLTMALSALWAITALAQAKPESSPAMQSLVCRGASGIFSDYSTDERIANCDAAIRSGAYAGEDLGWLLVNRGTFHMKKDETDPALADFTAAANVMPANGAPLIDRAILYAERRQYDPALADLDRAIALDPDSYAGFVNRATVHLKKHEMGLALADANKAVGIDSDGGSGLRLRGDIELMGSDFDGAIRDYDKAIVLDSKGAKAFNSRCYARALAKRDMESLALKDCNRALRLAPNDPHVLDSRGFLYLRLGRYDEAIADYDAALAGKPTLTLSLYGRAQAKQSKGDTAGAAADFAAANALDPKIAQKFANPAALTTEP